MATTTSVSKKPCAIHKTDADVGLHFRVQRDGSSADILKCRACGLVYVDEARRANKSFEFDAAQGDLETQWARQFPDALDTYAESAWGHTSQDAHDVIGWQYQRVAALLGDRLNAPHLTIAELGCSRGDLLAKIKQHHPQVRLVGVEPSPVMAAHVAATGAAVVNGVFEDGDFAPRTLDAVIAFGSFIQVRDPLSTLQHINRALKAGGKLLLDSPNDDSLFRWLSRWLWRHPGLATMLKLDGMARRATALIYNPGRFYYYTPKTYTHMLDMMGFKVNKVVQRQPRFLVYGKAKMSGIEKAGSRLISLAERLTSRQNWVEVHAVKVRDVASGMMD